MTQISRTRLAGHRQQGTTLIVAMILLVVLTMLGVTALQTSTMEERMAANTQEQNRAFQAAETGLELAYNDKDSFDINAPTTGKSDVLGIDYQAGTNYVVSYRGWTDPPPLDKPYSADQFSAYHFDTRSAAGSRVTDPGGVNPLLIDDSAAVVVVHGGAFQIFRKAN